MKAVKITTNENIIDEKIIIFDSSVIPKFKKKLPIYLISNIFFGPVITFKKGTNEAKDKTSENALKNIMSSKNKSCNFLFLLKQPHKSFKNPKVLNFLLKKIFTLKINNYFQSMSSPSSYNFVFLILPE